MSTSHDVDIAFIKSKTIVAVVLALGGLVLCTSVMWAYFAYRARPKLSSRSETRNTVKADGSSESYEFRPSTQIGADPASGVQQGGSATQAKSRSDM